MKERFVILALIIAIGIFNFLALRIKLGQISDSTKKIAFGFQLFKNFFIRNSVSNGKYLWQTFLNFLNFSLAKLPELRVTVVIRSIETKTAGQYATVSVINICSEQYILSGDTGS